MKHFIQGLSVISEKYKNNTAFINASTKETYTFAQMESLVLKITDILRKYVKGNQNKILLYMKTEPMFNIIDFAILYSKNISVNFDYSQQAQAVNDIAKTIKPKAVVTDNINLVEIYNNPEAEKQIIFYVGDEKDISGCNKDNITIYCLNKLIAEAKEAEINNSDYDENILFTLYFSTGTTGIPKAVAGYSEGVTFGFQVTQEVLPLDEGNERCLTILAPAHIGPYFSILGALFLGNKIIYSDYLDYKQNLKEYKPTYLIAVPKILLMHYDEYLSELDKQGSVFKFIHNIFYKISEKYFLLNEKSSRNVFETLNMNICRMFNILGINLVFGKILKKINLSKNLKIMSFGALLDIKTRKLLSILGCKIYEMYGMTETGMLAYSNDKVYRFGSVGKVAPDISLKICDPITNENLGYNKTGLIRIKESHLMPYYYNPEETEALLDSEGYFSTGDMGYLTEDNYLYFRGRCKNIIVLDNGENISPEWIEELCRTSDFVSQIMLVGQDKPYLTAIVVPDMEYIAEKYNVKDANEIKKEIIININDILGNSPSFKWMYQIKNILLADEPFTVENGLLTKKLAINKQAVLDKYSASVEELYKNNN